VTTAAPAPVLAEEESAVWARRVLAEQEMLPGEIEAVLISSDPRQIHRYMELHAECLEERLAAKLRVLAEVERVVIDGALLRSRAA